MKTMKGRRKNLLNFIRACSYNGTSLNLKMDPITCKTRRSFDLNFKLEVVKYAKEKSGEAAAKEYGVNPKQVREWKKREHEMLKLLSNKQNKGVTKMRKRCGGAGRKKLNTELDFHLLNWVMNQQMNSLPVSRLRIRKQAERIFPTLNDNPEVSFKASTGWLCNFLARNKVSLRKRETAAQAHVTPNTDPNSCTTRRSFDLDFKLQVVKFAKEKSGEAAAKEFGVDPKQVREWKKREPEMLRLLSTIQNKGITKMRKRCGGAGQKLLNTEVSFKASTGWLCNFLARNKVSLRKRTTAAQAHVNLNTDPNSYTPRRSFDLDFKLKVVRFAKEKSGEAAAKEFGVDPKQVREWKKREPEMLRLLSTIQNKGITKMRKRCGGAGRKLLNTELDFHVLNWIMNQQMNSLPLSRRIIRKEAERIFPTLNDNPEVIFKASRGWLCNFLSRNKLSLRKRETAAQVPA